ncbi:sensor histidine kinase [Micrococcus sp. M4NT]|uniref:sensor histidine kinase n=1 Tax=Micrococcus sp. M4NT TaxID=2957501 RepID=UPI0029A54C8D|nr:sensor histidine kinase [Micrococcus sp. M4NT]MDX2341909.1 sensor histidine kinase [Micrococcus sp. M4NT]
MVSTLASDPLNSHPDLGEQERSWLQMLVGDWQLVADLGLADLVLWYPVPHTEPAGGYVAVAQVRPFTAPTLFQRDIVGSRVRADLRALVDRVWRADAPGEGVEPVVAPGGTLQVRLWPVVREGRVIGVVSAHADPNSRPARSAIEENYGAAADQLLDMMQHGRWPDPEDPPAFWIGGTPRVGDGLVVLGADSRARFTSPNAVSALRRLGVTAPLLGRALTDILLSTAAARRPVEEGAWSILGGRRAGRTEVQAGGATLTVRSVPLRGGDGWTGALLMLRDVTELRRQEQRLVSKDATIREIHHRVKNNLQTVGSLLRIQARRMDSTEAGRALRQAMQRVDTIALVHQTLSEEIDGHIPVDGLLQRQFRLAVEVAGDGRPLATEVTGEFGELPTHVATPLALVLNELATNAVEHGTGPGGGHVALRARQEDTPSGRVLVVTVEDGGTGAPLEGEAGDFQPAPTSSGLGLRIVQTLVEGDLRGAIRWERRPDGGTRVSVRVPAS